MFRSKPIAIAALVFAAAGLAHADKLGSAKVGHTDSKVSSKREMPTNDDFQSVTFRAGAGGSSPACCPADLDCNGLVDASDLAIVLNGWGACGGCAGDIDGNGTIDASDLALVLNAWGVCVG
ncbi:MAG: Dockerin type domain [Planctomycetota bacterium]|jgi:hypothetical protein